MCHVLLSTSCIVQNTILHSAQKFEPCQPLTRRWGCLVDADLVHAKGKDGTEREATQSTTCHRNLVQGNAGRVKRKNRFRNIALRSSGFDGRVRGTALVRMVCCQLRMYFVLRAALLVSRMLGRPKLVYRPMPQASSLIFAAKSKRRWYYTAAVAGKPLLSLHAAG